MMTYIGCVKRVREINRGGGGNSFRISKCLLGSTCAFSLGGKQKKAKARGGR